MKFLLLLSFLFTSAIHLSAQSDTTILYLDSDEKPCPQAKAARYAIQNKEKDHWKKVVFDALDDKPIYGAYYSDPACTLFDGSYSAFNKDQKVIVAGRYVNDKKVNVWRRFSDDGKLIDSAFYRDGFIYGTALTWYTDGSVQDSLFFENNGNGISRGYWPNGKPKESGNFIAGKKNGLWTYNYKSGMKCQEVKYEADSALSYTCYDLNGQVQSKDCYYEKEAVFGSGDKGWRKYLGDRLSSASFPRAYNEGKIYGTVYIQFVVDSDGKVTDVKVIKSAAPELDKIALNIIQQSPRWEPAVQFNRNVRAYRKQPITFSKAER
jgi:TonB family protein